MTINEIEKIFRNLAVIKPDQNYSRKSKTEILSRKQAFSGQLATARGFSFSFKNIFEIAKLSGAISVIGLLILILMGSVSYINKNFSPLGLEGLNQKSLVVEAEGINNSIQITLQEIKHLDQSNKKAIETIEKVSQNKPIYTTLNATASSSNETASGTVETLENFLIDASVIEKENNEINDLLDKAMQQ